MKCLQLPGAPLALWRQAGGTGLLVFCLAAVLLLTACSALDLISETSPSSHYRKVEAVPYGSHPRQQLDHYLPIDETGQPRTVEATVVFFYGGGWREGARGNYEFVASTLTDAGFEVVIPDYRLYPEVAFPAFVADAAKALAWVDEQRGGGEGTDAPLYLAGHSAGAHIAALLATDQSYLARENLPGNTVDGLIGLSGPYDFLPIESGYLLDVFPEESRQASQPIYFASGGAPPTLLVHGKDDEVVDPGNSKRFAAALRQAGVPVTLRLYEGTGHAAVAAAMAPQLSLIADTSDDVIAFINQQDSGQSSQD